MTRQHVLVSHLVCFLRIPRCHDAHLGLEARVVEAATTPFPKEDAATWPYRRPKELVAFLVDVERAKIALLSEAFRQQRLTLPGPHVATGAATILMARKSHAVGSGQDLESNSHGRGTLRPTGR